MGLDDCELPAGTDASAGASLPAGNANMLASLRDGPDGQRSLDG